MSVTNKISYLHISIILLSSNRVAIIFIVKLEIDNIAFTIEYTFEGQSTENMEEIIPSGYVLYAYIFRRLCFGRQG